MIASIILLTVAIMMYINKRNKNKFDYSYLEDIYHLLSRIDKKLDNISGESRALKTVNSKESYMPENKDFRQLLYNKNKKHKKNKITPLPGRYEEIIEMEDNGYSPEYIAEKLNLGIRETKLIIKIKDKR